MINLLKEKFRMESSREHFICGDNDIIAPADGELFPLEDVKDEVFAKKMLGDGVAFRFKGKKTILCSPCNGILSVLYPTGHMYGITMKSGVEILVHIGIDTVEAKGKGFKILGKKPDEKIYGGDPIVCCNFDELSEDYDMSTMVLIANPNGKKFSFVKPGFYKKGSLLIQSS